MGTFLNYLLFGEHVNRQAFLEEIIFVLIMNQEPLYKRKYNVFLFTPYQRKFLMEPVKKGKESL